MLPSFLRVARPSLATAASKSRCVRNTNGPNVGALLCSVVVVVVVGKSCWSVVSRLSLDSMFWKKVKENDSMCEGGRVKRVRVNEWRQHWWFVAATDMRKKNNKKGFTGWWFIHRVWLRNNSQIQKNSQPGHGRGRIEDEEVVAAVAAAEGPA